MMPLPAEASIRFGTPLLPAAGHILKVEIVN